MSVGWLHISDLHQGMREQGWLWPNLRELFFDDLSRIHEKCGPWDLILFTGDLTLKGAKDEFLAANAALEDLMSHLHQLGSDPVLLPIPGNHDLQRPGNLKPEVRAFTSWDDDSELQAEFWDNPASPYRKTVESAFTNYQAWWAQWREAHPSSSLAALQMGLLPGDFAASIGKEHTKGAHKSRSLRTQYGIPATHGSGLSGKAWCGCPTVPKRMRRRRAAMG